MLARFVRAALVVVALAVASPIAAADPTIGARLSPAEFVIGRHDAVSLTNRSTVPVTVHLDAAGEGWAVDVTDFHLEPDEERSVRVIAGDGEAVIRAALVPILADGIDVSALVLETNARYPSPWEAIPAALWLVAALMGLGVLWAALRRFRRHRAD